jgi:hypothetical protein
MQDRYAFDVGDFGKVGLLRFLAPNFSGSLRVVWYATDIAPGADDGKHTAYLEPHLPSLSQRVQRTYRACDPVLFDAFRAALGGQAPVRSIARLESLGVLPGGARGFTEIVATGASRPAWFARAHAAVRDAGLIFCDPDNGLARPGSELERRGSAKHMLVDEVRQVYANGHSLVLYHHLTREAGGHVAQINAWRRTLTAATGCTGVSAVHFRRGSARAFFVLPQPKDRNAAASSLRALDSSNWAGLGHLAVWQ